MQSSGAARPWIEPPPPVEPLALRRVPLLAAALSFAAGIGCAARWHPPALLAASVLGLFVLALLSLRSAPRLAMAVALAWWIALGCGCAQLQPQPSRQEQLAPFADGLSRTVRGVVVRTRPLHALRPAGTPQAEEAGMEEDTAWEPTPGALAQSIDLQVMAAEDVTPDRSEMRAVQGGVRLTVSGRPIPARCGQMIEAPLRLRKPEVYRDPGAFSYADSLLAEGIGYLAATPADRVTLVGTAHAPWRCRLFAAQEWAAARLDGFVKARANRWLPRPLRVSAQDASLLEAMLFGDRTALTHELRLGFERTGTFHLFVVSGVHVALLATGLFWCLRRLRLNTPAAVCLTLAITFGYTLLTGFGVPAQRALWMTACVLLARCLRRRPTALNALGFAAIVVLALSPRALYESGFQMTFLVLVAVAGLAAPLDARLFSRLSRCLARLEETRLDAFMPPRDAERRVRLRMACGLAAALLHPRLRNLPVWLLRGGLRLAEFCLFASLTEACMVLPMATNFHRATLLALPANLFVVPAAALLLGLGMVFFLALLMGPWVAVLPAALCAGALHLVELPLARLNRSALADVRVPGPTLLPVLAACALIAFACWALRARRRAWAAAGVLAIALTPVLVLWPAPPRLHTGWMEVTALDVGQGDCLLVVTPDGHTLLVDAGGPSGFAAVAQARERRSDRWEIGEDVVAPYLWSRGLRRLDAVALTHAHSDHMGGMAAVLRDFAPRELWLSTEPGDSPALGALLAQARAEHVTVRHMAAPEQTDWHGVRFEVLAPEAGYANPGTPRNDDSLVLRAAFGQASVLLEGDAEAPSEAMMLARGRVAPSTLLKVGHHGSRTSTTPPFLAAVAPREALVSVGRNNTFGHPRAEVLAELEQQRVRTLRTDRVGAETFLLSADGRIVAEAAGPR